MAGLSSSQSVTTEPVPAGRPPAGRLLVRPLRSEDLAFFRELAQDERVTRYVGDGAPWTDAYVQQRFDDALRRGEIPGREVLWLIAETSAGSPVGLLALTIRPRETEVGYWVAPGHWRNGYGTRLVDDGLSIARARSPEVPVVATVHRDNLASRRILEREQFTAQVSDSAAPEMEYRRPPMITNNEK